MSAIIEGYSYDIFISYRQKDNKGDHWVSKFVEALKTELESTFKEEISLYFDSNALDGLLETDEVDASLKNKLRCLIFIPIISRTYCDQKSFAWEHEFKVFMEIASKDQFGLKVKLPNGNVASRVLPVRIHDLEKKDIKECESVLGSSLRGLEFIYREPGVNKPLSKSDPKYSIQINKVSNTIREIFSGLQAPVNEKEEKLEFSYKPGQKKERKTTRILIGAVLGLILITAGYFLLNFLKKDEPEKSIAVLPFKLLSDEPEKQYLADGMMDAITLHLAKIKDLRVLGRTSTEQYRNPAKTTSAIGHDLNVSYLLEGSFMKFGDSLRLIVHLIKTGKEGNAWAESYDMLYRDIFNMQRNVAQEVAKELNAVLTPDVINSMMKMPTPDLTAYDFYLQGKEEYTKYWLNHDSVALKKAEIKYRQALQYDSQFAEVYADLAKVYLGKNQFKTYYSESFLDSVPLLCNIAIRYNSKLADAYSILGDYYREKGEFEKAIEDYDKSIQFNPNSWESYFGKGTIYWGNDLVKTIDNYQLAASLNHGRELANILYWISHAYTVAGFGDKSLHFANEFFKLNGDSNMYTYNRFMAEIYAGNYMKAAELAERLLALDSANIDPMTLFFIAYNFQMLGQNERSLKYFRQMTELSGLKPEFYGHPGSEHRFGYAYWVTGDTAKAYYNIKKALYNSLKQVELKRPMAQSYFSYYDIAADYAFLGLRDSSFKYLRIFNQKPVMFRWFSTYMKIDPLFKNISNEPEFRQILEDVERKYQAEHERVGKWLEVKSIEK